MNMLNRFFRLKRLHARTGLQIRLTGQLPARLAKQQCAGPLQLPLNNLGAIALDYRGRYGMATSIGHAPAAGLD